MLLCAFSAFCCCAGVLPCLLLMLLMSCGVSAGWCCSKEEDRVSRLIREGEERERAMQKKLAERQAEEELRRVQAELRLVDKAINVEREKRKNEFKVEQTRRRIEADDQRTSEMKAAKARLQQDRVVRARVRCRGVGSCRG